MARTMKRGAKCASGPQFYRIGGIRRERMPAFERLARRLNRADWHKTRTITASNKHDMGLALIQLGD